MKTKDMFPSKYLTAESELMDDDNRPLDMDVTITGFLVEEFKNDAGDLEEKYVLYFNETVKGLILNKTNYKTLKKVHPVSDTDEWVGKQITLFATEVSYMGDMVWGTRIRLATPGELEYVE